MKKIILGVLTLILFSAEFQAQNTEPSSDSDSLNIAFKHSLKVKPLSTLGGEFGLSYERVIKPKRSLNFYAEITFEDIFDDPTITGSEKIGDYNLSRIGVDYRFYLSKQKLAPKGWYAGVGPLAYLLNYKYDNSNDKDNIFYLGARAHSGYQWVFKNGINIGADGGIQYNKALSREFNISGLSFLVVNFAVGYSWN